MAVRASKASFLLGADLTDPDARIGRRKRARDKAEKREAAELHAEKVPRSQKNWLEEEKKRSRLPVAGDAVAAAEPRHRPGDDEGLGKKKAKRLAALETKQSKKANVKALGRAKMVEASKESMKKSAKKGEACFAAQDMIRRCGRSAVAQLCLVAEVADQISAQPESKIELFDVFFELHTKSEDPRTRLLSLITAVAVFKDLVPGYKIREPNEAEKLTQRSKETLNIEQYELSLLKMYKKLLPLLEIALKRHTSAVAPAMAQLVKAAHDFNYKQRLLGIAVRHANGPHTAARETLCEGLREAVVADQRLETSREIVVAIGRLAQGAAAATWKGGDKGNDGIVKTRGLRKELFEVLLHLKLGRSEAAELNDAAENSDDEMQKDLAEGSIRPGAAHLRKAEAEVLTEIFVVYLRILRQRHLHPRETLAAVLVGLARWGSQVNLELISEIINELREVVQGAVNQSDELVSLQGLNCAMVLLSGPAEALTTTDFSWLSDTMQRALALAVPSLYSSYSESSVWPPPRCFVFDGSGHSVDQHEVSRALEISSVPALVLRCLSAALRCPQAYGKASDSSLAMLVEHLFHLAAAADSHVGLGLLQEAATVLRRNRQLHPLLDTEGGLFRVGGLGDSSVSVAWHLHVLGHALAPWTAKVGESLAAVVPSRLKSPADLFPAKNARSWLGAEFLQHLSPLARAPEPKTLHKGKRAKYSANGARGTAGFLTEAELRGACGSLPSS